ncbi:MAG TPA: hypothetical protein VN909_05445 [Candidatus Dormibacteraeota bacterium]|nr:hypothetical protein [Candidatus Dormibacteraeota bacterium]
MALSNKGAALLLTGGALFALSACGGSGAVPSGPAELGNAASQLSRTTADASPADSTSILKKLTKNVVIGSTVDPGNGDMGPRGLSIAPIKYGVPKGELAVCNFEDSSGAAGKGTTIELLDPKAGSSPSTFAQSSKIAGCDGVAFTNSDGIYAGGMTTGLLVAFSNSGKLSKTYGPPFKEPFSNTDASNPGLYAAEYMFTSDATTGTVVSFSINQYGNKKRLEVVSGFAVNKASGWGALGPSGIQYYPKKDTLYVADGVTNTIVSFNNASELLVKDEIVVQSGGKTFKCKYPKTTCGTLVYAGKDLNAPVAMTVLPNGNLIVANSKGGNKLIELTPTGTVLATKVVDSKKTPGVFGLIASGKNDTDTVLFYTDTNDNSLHELEQ